MEFELYVKMTERLSTGVGLLDDKLDGGVPLGSLITFESRPASQSDLLVNHFIEPNRAIYITTQRSRKAVEKAVEASAMNPEYIEFVDATSNEESITKIREQFDEIEEHSIIVIDKIEELEQKDDYGSLLRDLQKTLIEKGAVAYLYRSENAGSGAKTRSYSDVIFQLHTDIDGSELQNRLVVPKVRGGPTVDEVVKLNLRREVHIDTSRDIA